MLWGQTITVYTDHKNLMQDALGLTSDQVYRWRLLLEEYGPTIEYIKGIHNTVVDAISRLDHGLVSNDRPLLSAGVIILKQQKRLVHLRQTTQNP